MLPSGRRRPAGLLAVEPQPPLPDEPLRLLVDVVFHPTWWTAAAAVEDGPGNQVVELYLVHLLHRYLPDTFSTGTGAGARRSSRVLAPTIHLRLLAK